MGIVAKKTESTYELPPAGTEQAVCAEVVDLGFHPNPLKPGKMQHKVLVLFQLAAERQDGSRFVIGKRYTLSLDERATLRHDLESWRGRAFTPQEEEGFDLDHVLSANGVLNIQHRESKGKTYANILTIMPLMRGMSKLKVEGYVRPEYVAKMIAPSSEAEGLPADDEHAGMVDADEIPF